MSWVVTVSDPARVEPHNRPVCRRFPGQPVQVQYVREFVVRQVARRGCPDGVLTDIALCVAELANNAVAHTLSGRPGGTFAVTVHVDGNTVHVEVADDGPVGEPMPAGDAEGGWGLPLVSAYAQRVGRVTWFERSWKASS